MNASNGSGHGSKQHLTICDPIFSTFDKNAHSLMFLCKQVKSGPWTTKSHQVTPLPKNPSMASTYTWNKIWHLYPGSETLQASSSQLSVFLPWDTPPTASPAPPSLPLPAPFTSPRPLALDSASGYSLLSGPLLNPTHPLGLKLQVWIA